MYNITSREVENIIICNNCEIIAYNANTEFIFIY